MKLIKRSFLTKNPPLHPPKKVAKIPEILLESFVGDKGYRQVKIGLEEIGKL